jgi:7,8-dihydroneopterin aldolase/epimerase/oxygenase
MQRFFSCRGGRAAVYFVVKHPKTFGTTGKPMGMILLEDLRLKVTIGVTERERSRKQKLLVSAEMELAAPAGENWKNDSIEDTVDYSEVRRSIKELAEGSRFNLIETLANSIAFELKRRFESKGARGIRVTVKKFPYRDAAYAAYRCDLPR